MRIGISITTGYKVEDVRQGARWMIERARAAGEARLDYLFFGDHHVAAIPNYQCTPILGRALAEWWDAPAGALYLLPLRFPVLLAEEVATLASLAPNRFIMQCALGNGGEEFEAFGVNSKHRPSRFEESLDVMRRLWKGETVTHQGRWQFKEARISPTPPENIDVWVAARVDPAIERAARLGDGWIASPRSVPDKAKRDLDLYHESCAKHGKAPGARVIRRDIYVGESQKEAKAIGEQVISGGYRGMTPESVIIGDVDSVAKAFVEWEKMGFTEMITRSLVSDQEKSLASISRLAKVKELLK
ncbi:MAG: LLM class flavin-dependent oxidoreductase [Deltaproteobacteria bacterium]|nr:LLM class flavin-dependent oxidoreductase [Deltaproteobacteria bacterium]